MPGWCRTRIESTVGCPHDLNRLITRSRNLVLLVGASLGALALIPLQEVFDTPGYFVSRRAVTLQHICNDHPRTFRTASVDS